MNSFVARDTDNANPVPSNPAQFASTPVMRYYLHNTVTKGLIKGINPCLLVEYSDDPEAPSIYGYGTVLPNCVGYAWGRFAEIVGDSVSLPSCNGGAWYNSSMPYTRNSSVPQLGAVACWAQKDRWGHVAIVEKILADGRIVVSQSGYSQPWSRRFWTSTLNTQFLDPGYMLDGTWQFQGFIYNPACADLYAPAVQLVDAAKAKVESNISFLTTSPSYTWVRECCKGRLGDNQPWSCAFVSACLMQVPEIQGRLVLEINSPTTFAFRNRAYWADGPYYTQQAYQPKLGDIIFIRAAGVGSAYSAIVNGPISPKQAEYYTSSYMGIVVSYTDTVVTIVRGDVGSGSSVPTHNVVQQDLRCTDQTILGVISPQWFTISSYEASLAPSSLSSVPKGSALLRQFGYIDANGEPSINTSNIKLSAMNWNYILALTTMNSTLADSRGQLPSEGGVTFNTEMLTSIERQVITYLKLIGFTLSAAVGIAASIKHLSNYSCKKVTTSALGTYIGLVQWSGVVANRMKDFCGKDWKDNLSGQLSFIWVDVSGSNRTLLDRLTRSECNSAGARDSGETFARNYCSVTKMTEVKQIGDEAVRLWNLMGVALV